MLRTEATSRRGFSIIELLVVISIIVIMGLIAMPFLRSMNASTRLDGGVAAVTVAIASARPYAMRSVSIVDPLDLFRYNPTGITPHYAGTAVIFGPSGEARIVQHNHLAESEEGGGNPIYLSAYPHLGLLPGANRGQLSTATRIADKPANLAAFEPVDETMEFVRLPLGVNVVGVVRTSSGTKLLSPPFAIRFGPDGQQMVPPLEQHVVAPAPSPDWRGRQVYEGMAFFDGDHNGKIQTNPGQLGSWRGNPYADPDPGTWSGGYCPGRILSAGKPKSWDRSDDTVTSNTNYYTTEGKLKLPFERIETVAAILVYSVADFDEHGLDLRPDTADATFYSLNSAAATWLLEADAQGRLKNARVVVLSRSTGVAVKEVLK